MKNISPAAVYLKDYTPSDYLIDTVDLEFELGETSTRVKSKLTVRENPASLSSAKKLILNGENVLLKTILLNGKELTKTDFKIQENKLIISAVPAKFELEIHTLIKPQENTSLTGLYQSNGNFCTQCEAHGFSHITYFLDRPDMMACYTTTIIADKEKYPILLSNGNLVASGSLGKDKHWVKWEDPFKKPCYLFALVAGDLERVQDEFITQSGRRVDLHIYVEKGNKHKCEHAMQAVKKAMKWDEDTFGREYDLDIYMIVAVSDFNMGAMENKGLNIFNTKYILASPETATDDDFLHVESVIAHEYCHNWSGNRVTCRDWFQLSLKEGLTIFRDQTFTEDTMSAAVARIHAVNDLRNSQFGEDAGPLAHPVRPESYVEINNFYTATVYNKGAEVIRMIQTLIGKEIFRQGLDLYFSRHDGQAVTIEDFVKAMEESSGISLEQFRLWYSQAGTPVLDIKDEYDPHHKTYYLTIRQSCPATPGQNEKLPFHLPFKIGLLNGSGEEMFETVLQVKKQVEKFKFDNISSFPIPSLLRSFSAPVKLHFSYSDEQLQFLMQHDTDLFNRWEAGTKYWVRVILDLVNDFQVKKKLQLPLGLINVFSALLQQAELDKWLLAEMLTLPSERYLAEQMTIIDVDAIHAVREFVITELANQLKQDFIETYKKNHSLNTYQFNLQEVGRRQLKNRCLDYLVHLDDFTLHEQLALSQFAVALKNNMTDTLSAIKYLTYVDSPLQGKILTQFYAAWKHDPLVVDKWLSLQAISKSPDTLDKVKLLTQHEAFDIKNPNKVYALIGAFARHNPVRFHSAKGEGYLFLTDIVLELNALNPQIAARMVTPLTDWKRYDIHRQGLMQRSLEMILKTKSLSRDVHELVSKSLQ